MGNVLTADNVTKIFEEVVSKKENENAIICDGGIRGRRFAKGNKSERRRRNAFILRAVLPIIITSLILI